MVKFIKKIFLSTFFLSILFSFLLIPSKSEAVIQGRGLTISPPLLEVTLNPGQTNNQKIRIDNPANELIEVYPVAMNFRAKDESGNPDFFEVAKKEEETFTLDPWLKFSEERIVVFPGQSIEWYYQINVPEKAEPGGHYGVIFFSTKPPEFKQDESELRFVGMLGQLILAKIPGDIIEKGNLKEFSSNKRLYLTLPNTFDFTVRIQNTGNVHFKPYGEIVIKDWRGKEKAILKVNEDQGNVLPQSIRKFTNTWSPKVNYFFETPIGRFKANLNVIYGDQKKVLSDTIVFWIIPKWLIYVLVIIVILIILFTTQCVIRKKRNRP